jgi:hypothetical protein
MAMKIKSLFILLLSSLLIACEERIDLPFQSESIDLLAVEGVLTNENINHKIKLSFPYQVMNGEPTRVSGAIVTIQQDKATFYTLTEFPVASGEYYTPVFRAVVGSVYTLVIQHQGKEYSAQDSSVPVEPLTALDYRRVNDEYTLNLNQNGESANYIDHNISWENTKACVASQSCDGRVVYYDLKTTDVNEIYKPNKVEFVFPAGTTIIRKKHSVSTAYRTFLRSVLSETEWRGGLFDVERANTATNLSAGAIGFFAVTSVVSDTTIVVEKP